jgi:exodeoxyribonuclease VII large subunit
MSLFETRHIYEVSELTRLIKLTLEESPISEVWVQGEVSNLSRPYSGHLYFKLKDKGSQIDCVIFKSLADKLRFMPEDGISLSLQGRLTVYEPRGTYQIIGNWIEPLGVGALQLAFEQLKQRLEAEGLFDLANKKPLPFMPRKIGVITSATGAAIKDILTILRRRFYNVHILIHPVAVQGEGSAEEIAGAIDTMNKIGGIDVLIVGRGGGSIEDLWAFNEEVVARSIYASEIPVISAVGHEIDFTISDFVADYRAPTPSAAAEMVIPNKADLVRTLDSLKSRLYLSMSNQMEMMQRQVQNNQRRLMLSDARNRIQFFQQNIDYLLQRTYNVLSKSVERKKRVLSEYQNRLLYAGIPKKASEAKNKVANLQQKLINKEQQIINTKEERFGIALAKLNSLSPLSILQRGYSLCRKYPDMETIRGISSISIGDDVEVVLKDGEIICKVQQINANTPEY